ncbi:PKD-like family lipoprotein [Sphingobacterium lactis]|uniref:PKD-like family lipoprotein n=1 Tax=Sphingobacterium lactis TaxID=797291 RepID=UPI003EC6992A
MKTKYILFSILLLICYACSKDSGNYDYSEVNKLTVVDTAGTPITEKTYDLMAGDTIDIQLKVSGTMPDFDPAKVNLTWVLGKDTIAKGTKVSFNSSMFAGGANVVMIRAVDYMTNAEYLYTINVNVTRGITRGIMILAEDAEKNGVLYLKSSLTTTSKILTYSALGKDDEYPIGAEPLNVELIYTGGRYPSFALSSKKGDYAWMLVDLPTMTPTKLVSRKGTGMNGGDLNITYYKNFWNEINGSGYMVENGKVRYLANGYLRGDVYAGAGNTYDFGKGNIAFTNFNQIKGTGLMGFDENSKRILLMQYNGSTPFVFPSVSQTLSSDPIEGVSYWGSGSDQDYGTGYAILLRNGDKISNYQTMNEFNWKTYRYEWTKFKKVGEGTVPNAEKAVDIRFNRWNAHFYYAVGRTIYRLPFASVAPSVYLTLPDDGSGDIVAWNFDREEAKANHQNIAIATYNPNSTKEKKGSFYHYSLKPDGKGQQVTPISSELFKIDKAVSVTLGVEL